MNSSSSPIIAPARPRVITYRAAGVSSTLRFTLPEHANELAALDPTSSGRINLFGVDHVLEEC